MSIGSVGDYEVLMPLGEGGHASVHLALSERDSLVALKLRHPHLSADPNARRSFEKEAEFGGYIAHPNVLKVRECIEGGDGLVLDYIEGGSLAELVQAQAQPGSDDALKTLPVPIAARIIFDALAGIEAIHSAKDASGRPLNLVHQDFTPENLMVGADGITRVSDFGNVGQSGHVASSGLVSGKAPYLAPEQIFGQPATKSSDIWTAGALTWELLAGRRLFKAADTAQAFHQITERQPKRLRSVNRKIPQNLDNAVSGALVNEPSARFASIAEFREALMAAWGEYSPVASHSEVSEFVAERMGARLSERRKRVSRLHASGTRKKLNTLLSVAAAGLAFGITAGFVVAWFS